MMNFNIIKSLYQLDDCGVQNDAIQKAKQRLDCQLPKVFKNFYQIIGNHFSNIKTHYYTLSVDDIYFDGEYLVICQCHDWLYGLKSSELNCDNPSIYCQEDKFGKWYLVDNYLSDFYYKIAFFNATLGEFNYGLSGNYQSDEMALFDLLKDDWQEIHIKQNNNHRYFINDLNVIMIVILLQDNIDDNLYGIRMACHDLSLFKEMYELNNFYWDNVIYQGNLYFPDDISEILNSVQNTNNSKRHHDPLHLAH